jgi:glutamine cyclotransferase
MDKAWFGEGLTRYKNKLYQITWLTNQGFIYSIPDLKQVGPGGAWQELGPWWHQQQGQQIHVSHHAVQLPDQFRHQSASG